MNKFFVALSIASTINISGCQSTSEQTRFVGKPSVNTFTPKQADNSNVMYEYEGAAGAVEKQSILHYPKKAVSAPEAKPKFTVVAAETSEPATIVTPLNEGIELEQPDKEKIEEVLESGAYSVDIPPAIAVGNIEETESTSDFSKNIFMQEYTLTPEDKIMGEIVDPLEYQNTPEVPALRIIKETSRVNVEVDEASVKAYLISVYYNTNTVIEDDREPLKRPESLVVFHGKKGTLNENINALIKATDGINVVSDISDNHRFDFDFTIKGGSALSILDQLVESFVAPYPVSSKIYKRNEVAHVFYKR